MNDTVFMLVEITAEDLPLLEHAATMAPAHIDRYYGDSPVLPLDPACWNELKQFLRTGVVAIPNRFVREIHLLVRSLNSRGDYSIFHCNDIRTGEQLKRLAARLLGIGKTTLYRKLKEYDFQA